MAQKTEEPQLADKLMERIDILARLLHDKPTPVKKRCGRRFQS
jgi:hypothetical protein